MARIENTGSDREHLVPYPSQGLDREQNIVYPSHPVELVRINNSSIFYNDVKQTILACIGTMQHSTYDVVRT